MRELIRSKLAEAELGDDDIRLSMLRLVKVTIEDKDEILRETGKAEFVSNETIHKTLRRMIEQREKSSVNFEEHGQLDLADRERKEILVVEELLPRMLAGAEIDDAVEKAIRTTRAKRIRDKGRVMQALKANYPGRMDFRKVDDMVIKRLS